MQLTRREIELVVSELRELLVPCRLQRVFEAAARAVVFQCRAPGVTHHLLLSADDDDTRLHLVDEKPNQPPHPSPFTMQLRKWVHGAWLEGIDVGDDRVVDFRLRAIDPNWEPSPDDDKAPRIDLVFVAELLGRHPNLVLLDEQRRIIGTATSTLLGHRDTDPGTDYTPPPPPPDWADDQKVRPILQDQPCDGSRSRVLADHFRQSLHERRRDQLERTLTTRLDRRIERLRRRIEHVESDLERIDDADEYRRRGELLQSAYGDVEPGASSATVPDFYREDMPPIEIPLDPSKSLQENIDRYFHEYRRLTSARDKVESRLLKSIELLESVEDARRQLDDIDEIDELRSFQDRLEADGRLRTGPDKRHSGPRRQKPLPPYREFRAKGRRPILVGRSARHNDTLTTSIARGRDIWLHARDWKGAHVILRMDKGEQIPSEDLIDAATVAAHFSEGRADTVVDVTYTEAKYVRKPSGAPPGLVTHGGGSTIAVRPDSDRLPRILDTEIDPR